MAFPNIGALITRMGYTSLYLYRDRKGILSYNYYRDRKGGSLGLFQREKGPWFGT